MEDYSKGKIYKIISDHCELPYIGSTIDSLEDRLDEHQRWYKKWINNGKKRTSGEYCSSAGILQYDDARIELVKNYPCNSKKELREYEGTFQQIGVNCVNIKKAGRSFSDWHKNVYYPENKEKFAKKQKIYRATPEAQKTYAYLKEKSICKYCGEELLLTCKSKINRHEKSKKCKKARNNNTLT